MAFLEYVGVRWSTVEFVEYARVRRSTPEYAGVLGSTSDVR
eukprot:gene9481-biopygen5495